MLYNGQSSIIRSPHVFRRNFRNFSISHWQIHPMDSDSIVASEITLGLFIKIIYIHFILAVLDNIFQNLLFSGLQNNLTP